MFEEETSKQDRVFKGFLVVSLRIMEAVGYVGIVAVGIAVVWVFWKSGWQELLEVIWPALAVCLVLAGSIWGAKLLKKLLEK